MCIALGGDADLVLLAGETGRRIDGDQILALIARSWLKQGRLAGRQIVATVMSNMGLERFLSEQGLELIRTAVGDRYVVEKMRELGANLGGEQSGHMLLSDFATTGDGLVAALQVLAVLVEDGRPASEVCRMFTPYPQLLRNVRFAGRSPLQDPSIAEAPLAADAPQGPRGRLVLREIGTEPLIRVMVEAQDEPLVRQVVDDMCAAIAAVQMMA